MPSPDRRAARDMVDLLTALSRVTLIQQQALSRIAAGDFKHPAHAQNIARRAILDAGSYLMEHTSLGDVADLVERFERP